MQRCGVLALSHWMAVAPNASSSLITGGTSPSIEPIRANVFRQDTISGAHIVKNRFLNVFWLNLVSIRMKSGVI